MITERARPCVACHSLLSVGSLFDKLSDMEVPTLGDSPDEVVQNLCSPETDVFVSPLLSH